MMEGQGASLRIRYLEQDEKRKTMDLWREAFPEDSESFLAYYYEEKTRDNRILVLEEEDGGGFRIVSMVHRNPYRLQTGKGRILSDYIVAVATAGDRRHRGYMKMLLTRMMEDMHREGMPFCYLMPADRRIYEPFGFAFIYDQEHWKLTEEAEEKLRKKIAGEEDADTAGAWMDQWLADRYQVFAVREGSYTKRLLKELESEKGRMEFLFLPETGRGTGEPAGIRCVWGDGRQEQRMLMCGPEYREEEKSPSPAIMVRIIDVKRCLEMVRLKKDSSAEAMEILIHVKDRVCPWNQGRFLWKLDRQGSAAVKLDEIRPGEREDGTSRERAGSPEHRTDMEIRQLTQWIFGYEDLPERTGGEKSDPWQQDIQVWKGVFLDEAV